jgi:uncharacterized protein (TIGR00730 family)
MSKTFRSLCVYCGSASGHDPAYAIATQTLGQQLAERGIELVYGGGHVGLMGILADAVLAAGGKVTGVIPKALMNAEVGHEHLTRLLVVKDMHERKALMAEHADGFMALPGGIGTLEELFEVMTWLQLGYHAKPVGLLNIAGFYDGLLSFIQSQVQAGFLRPEHHALLLTSTDSQELIEQLLRFEMPAQVSVFERRAARTLGP